MSKKHKSLWLTDIHLDFIKAYELDLFIDSLIKEDADSILITGDIGNANTIEKNLTTFAKRINIPIFFVLGNHDFYHSSISKVRKEIESLCDSIPNLHYMSSQGIMPLNSNTALVGHDGWGDGRLGDYHDSPVLLNDFNYIKELKNLNKSDTLKVLNKLGDESAEHISLFLPKALSQYKNVIIITHVPPFRESAWHEGESCDEDWLPFFSNKALGDILYKKMSEQTDKKITVLCGHTHSSGKSIILDNLITHTGGAKYRYPTIQEILWL